MAVFRYRAQTATGALQRGYMEAASAEEIARVLKGKRLYPVRIRRVRRVGLVRGVPEQEIIELYRDLAGLLESGLSMDRALALSAANVKSKVLSSALTEVLESVRKGGSLSEAMGEHAGVFGHLSVSLVKAGEMSGGLRKVLLENAENMESRRTFKQRMVSVMVYPIILLLVSLLSIVILLVFVIPKFGQIFTDLDQDIPMVTSMLLAAGTWLRDNSLYIPLALLAVFLAGKVVLSRPGGRLFLDRAILRAPVVRNLVLEAELSRFFRSLGVLLQGGVPMLKSIGLVEDVLQNRELKARMRPLTQKVRAGGTLSDFFRSDAVFPGQAANMLHIAEEQGMLAKGMIRLGDLFERSLRQKLERMATLAEPAVIIVTGLFIGLTVLSMFSAIFGITDIQM